MVPYASNNVGLVGVSIVSLTSFSEVSCSGETIGKSILLFLDGGVVVMIDNY